MKYDMKPIVDLMNNSIESLNKLITKPNKTMTHLKQSKFMDFLVGLRGHLLYKGDRLLDKWEAFEMTDKTPREIINGESKFTLSVDHDYKTYMINH